MILEIGCSRTFQNVKIFVSTKRKQNTNASKTTSKAPKTLFPDKKPFHIRSIIHRNVDAKAVLVHWYDRRINSSDNVAAAEPFTAGDG